VVRHPILGLHHVTATVAGAQHDLDCYAGSLAMRLVKKTVNFDNHNVYHFYYGDEQGSPGTIWTTFPYQGWGVPAGATGSGQITATAFSVPAGAVGYWKKRLSDAGVTPEEGKARFGETAIAFRDPSGLLIELVATERDQRPPWRGPGVEPDCAVRGLHSVTMVVRSPGPTLDLLTGLLGFTVVDQVGGRTRVAVQGDEPGKTIDIVHDAQAPPGRNGTGTVHHVALAISSADQQILMRQELVRLGYAVTEVMDRCYFRSIYFREPGGVLFELATVEPGFTVDEDLASLGQGLKLPPWEEPNRPMIEERLPRITLKG